MPLSPYCCSLYKSPPKKGVQASQLLCQQMAFNLTSYLNPARYDPSAYLLYLKFLAK